MVTRTRFALLRRRDVGRASRGLPDGVLRSVPLHCATSSSEWCRQPTHGHGLASCPQSPLFIGLGKASMLSRVLFGPVSIGGVACGWDAAVLLAALDQRCIAGSEVRIECEEDCASGARYARRMIAASWR